MLLLNVCFYFRVISTGRKKNVDTDSLTCQKICFFLASSMSVCVYTYLQKLSFFSVCSLRRGINQETQHFDFTPKNLDTSIYFSFSQRPCLKFQIENVSIFSSCQRKLKRQIIHACTQKSRASEGIERVLRVTHHQIVFPHFFFFVVLLFFSMEEKEKKISQTFSFFFFLWACTGDLRLSPVRIPLAIG